MSKHGSFSRDRARGRHPDRRCRLEGGMRSSDAGRRNQIASFKCSDCRTWMDVGATQWHREDGMAGPIRVGIVGCGEVAQIIHLPALIELRDLFAVTALCDV